MTERYPSLVSSTQRFVNLELLAQDYLFICPVRFAARKLASFGLTVRTFIFDHVFSFAKQGWGEAYKFCDNFTCHGSELPFEFGSAMQNYTLTYGARVGDV